MKIREINEKGQKNDQKIGRQVLHMTCRIDSSYDVEFFKIEKMKIE